MHHLRCAIAHRRSSHITAAALSSRPKRQRVKKEEAAAASARHKNRKHDYWCFFIFNRRADSTDVAITQIPALWLRGTQLWIPDAPLLKGKCFFFVFFPCFLAVRNAQETMWQPVECDSRFVQQCSCSYLRICWSTMHDGICVCAVKQAFPC